MSTQSIIHKDKQALSDNVDKGFICMSDNYLRNKKFGVGKRYNRTDFKKMKWLDRILCGKNCYCEDVRDRVSEKLNLMITQYI